MTDAPVPQRRKTQTRGMLPVVLAILAALAVVIAFLVWPKAAPHDEAKVVRIGLALEPVTLDIRVGSGVAIEQILIDNVYEGLVSRNADLTLEPGLTDYEVSSDGLRYTFTLRSEDIRFHSGTPLTVDDAVASITEVLTNPAAVGNWELTQVVDRVTKLSENSFEITLKVANNDFLWHLSGEAGLVYESGWEGDYATETNGTGPFVLADWKKGDSILFEKNTDYWGEEAQVAGVEFVYILDLNAGINATKEGVLDVQAVIDATMVSELDTLEGFTVAETATTGVFTLAFNQEREPLNDIRVRQAIRRAIDRDSLIAALNGGSRLGGPIPSLDPGYEDLTAIDAFNQTSARALLAEAGYSDGLELTLTISNSYPETFGAVLASQLAEVGIGLTVLRVPFATWLDDVFIGQQYDLSIVNHAEPRDFVNYTTPGYYLSYSNPEVDELYQQALAATTVARQEQLLAQAARIVSEDAGAEWLLEVTNYIAIRDGIEGFPQQNVLSRIKLNDLRYLP